MLLLYIQLPRMASASQFLLLLLTVEDYSTRAQIEKTYSNRNSDVPNRSRMTNNTCILIQTSRPALSVPSIATGALAPQFLKQYICTLLLGPAPNTKPTLQIHLTVSQAFFSNNRIPRPSSRHKNTHLLLPNTLKPKPSLLSFPHPSASPLQPVSAFHNTATRPRCYPFLKAGPHRPSLLWDLELMRKRNLYSTVYGL
jgi:hypothetical protein